MKVTIKMVYIKLNKGDFTKTLIESLETQNRQAARAWLKAVITRVPIWTGMAQGSLRPLGQYLRVAIPITPSSSPRAQIAIAHGQNITAGEAMGHFQFKVEAGKRIVFIYKTDVIHYLINEFYDVRPEIHLTHEPVPWFSFRVGKAAYKQYLTENLKKKIPKIKSFLTSEIRDIGSLP
jgi:hypothetical protein